MTLSLFSSWAAGDDNPDPRGPADQMIQMYRRCCIQAIRLSDYTKPGRYTIETILAHMEGEFILATNDQVSCYLLLGIAIRLALRMGLHRDPDKVCGSLTPFEAEIRRRLWHLLKQIDLLASFHIGLPSMVESIDSDTELPQNLNDDDFTCTMTTLPPPRPNNEVTTTSYLINKSRICEVFGQIATHANSLKSPSYDEVLRLDKDLNEAYASIPPMFQVRSMDRSITDSPQIILFRFNLGHLYNKSRCVLHRKFLIGIDGQPPYEYSIKVGLEAAMDLMSFQSQISEAAQPGGPLARDRCFPSSLLMHDYLLGAMIVYMRTMKVLEAEKKGDPITPEIQKQKTDMISTLRTSSNVWSMYKMKFSEGKRAWHVINMMLEKIDAASGVPNVPMTNPWDVDVNVADSNSLAGLTLDGKCDITLHFKHVINN